MTRSKQKSLASLIGVLALCVIAYITFSSSICIEKKSIVVVVAVATKYALLVSLPDGMQMSGRAGSVVHQKNGIRRNFVSPGLVQNAFTTAVRNRLAAFSSTFRSLSPSDQSTWRALSMTVTNRLGKPITIKGKQVYVRLNGNLDNIGVTENPSAPTLEGQIGVEFDSPVIDVSDAKIQLGLTNADAGAGIVIFASLPVPAGHSKARMAQIYKASDSTTVSVTHTWDGYVAKWSYTPVAGDKIMLSAKYINATTGEESPLAVIGIVTVIA